MDTNILVEGFQPQSERDAVAFTNQIGPGYFETLGTALITGRDFDGADTQSTNPIAIVNEAFGKKFFSGQDPVGKVFQTPGPSGLGGMLIVGLVEDAKYNSMRETVPPTFYTPISRALGPRLVFSLKTAVAPMSISSAVGAAMGSIDKNISFASRTFQSQVDDSIVQERLIAMLSAFFGTLALIIAATGLAGLVSYSVSRRRSEIGIRAALGATPASLIHLVMRDVFAITACGLVVGGVLSFAGGRLIAKMLYQISPDDPVTLVLASSTLILAALLAGYIPARRAARIDPVQCLRSE
jgi:predicted permease